jgi:hypothetical protein
MSKSLRVSLLTLTLSWFAVSCSGPIFIKPPAARSAIAVPVSTTQPAVAASSPWTGAGIFFYPFVLICVTFGIAIYSSSGKTA